MTSEPSQILKLEGDCPHDVHRIVQGWVTGRYPVDFDTCGVYAQTGRTIKLDSGAQVEVWEQIART